MILAVTVAIIICRNLQRIRAVLLEENHIEFFKHGLPTAEYALRDSVINMV